MSKLIFESIGFVNVNTVPDLIVCVKFLFKVIFELQK